MKALAREGYFDGLSIIRVHENYVAPWGDADGGNPAKRRAVRAAKEPLSPEFDRQIGPDLPFTSSPDGDLHAAEAGWSGGFPGAKDPKSGRTWPPIATGRWARLERHGDPAAVFQLQDDRGPAESTEAQPAQR